MHNLAGLEWQAGKLRHSIAIGDFAASEAAASLYIAQVARTISELPPDRARTTVEEACALLEWARRNICAARASLATRLAALRRVSGYAPPAIADPAFTLRG
ncbi:MAG TPA: hypothetical protein VN736_11805 [Candidatus Limnocylindrales bacterium]|nr:hypothetical protein [Candidatus Limnocylindrales bacterium]